MNKSDNLILDKLFIYSVVVASQSDVLLSPFLHTKPVYVLLSVRVLNRRYNETNDFTIVRFMKANKHTTSFKAYDAAIALLLESGYIIRSGKNNTKIYITTAGHAALNLLESTLRKSTFRYRKNVAVNIPLKSAAKKKKRVTKIK